MKGYAAHRTTEATLEHAGRQSNHHFKDLRSASHAKTRTRKYLRRYRHIQSIQPIDLPSHLNQQEGYLAHNIHDFHQNFQSPKGPRSTKREGYFAAQRPRHRSSPNSWVAEEKRKAKRAIAAEAAEPLSLEDELLIYYLPFTNKYIYKFWRCCGYCDGGAPEMNEDGTLQTQGIFSFQDWQRKHDGFHMRCLLRMAEVLTIKDDKSPSRVALATLPDKNPSRLGPSPPRDPKNTSLIDLSCTPTISAEAFLASEDFENSGSWLSFSPPSSDDGANSHSSSLLINEEDSYILPMTYYNHILRSIRTTLLRTFWFSQPTNPTFWSNVAMPALVADRVHQDYHGAILENSPFRNRTGCWEEYGDVCECEWCCVDEFRRFWDPESRWCAWWLDAWVADEDWDAMRAADVEWEVGRRKVLEADGWSVVSMEFDGALGVEDKAEFISV